MRYEYFSAVRAYYLYGKIFQVYKPCCITNSTITGKNKLKWETKWHSLVADSPRLRWGATCFFFLFCSDSSLPLPLPIWYLISSKRRAAQPIETLYGNIRFAKITVFSMGWLSSHAMSVQEFKLISVSHLCLNSFLRCFSWHN